MANDLKALVARKIFKKSHILVPSIIKLPKPDIFIKQIKGAAITDVYRRAKYIIFKLSNMRSLIVHPKMTGHFIFINKETDKNREFPKSLKYTRIRFEMSGASELCFSDVRKFGTMRLLGEKETEEFLSSLGPEPLTLKRDEFINIMKSRRGKIKQVLMNPAVLSGIGNIYSDEVLYVAGVHPEQRTDLLPDDRYIKLHEAINEILLRAIKLRGSSINNYRDIRGDKGGYQDVRLIYGREGEKCFVCEEKILKIKVAGRSACFCPKCQKKII